MSKLSKILRKVYKKMKDMMVQLISLVLVWLIDKTKDEEIWALGNKSGVWLTTNIRKGMGVSWEHIEDKLQNKMAVFMGGLGEGLNSDDEVK